MTQVEIAFRAQRAVIVEMGGGLCSYSGRGGELLDGFAVGEPIASGRGQVLMPWPNRIEDGAYEFDGNRYQLPITEPERGNAIHGLVRSEPWTTGAREPHRVVMEYLLEPAPGYPFALELAVEYALSESGLSVQTTATNVGEDACPFGSGQHPYVTLGTPTVDSLILRARWRTVLTVDERGIPRGREPVDGTEYDFRRPREIGATRLDHAFTDLERGDGRTRPHRAAGPAEPQGPHALAGRVLRLPAALHRRPAPGRRAAQPRRRADDLPGERVSDRRGARPPRARRVVHGRVGHRPLSFEREKQLAAEAAAEVVESGMTVGLGTGLDGRLPAPGAGGPEARAALRRDLAGDRAGGA